MLDKHVPPKFCFKSKYHQEMSTKMHKRGMQKLVHEALISGWELQRPRGITRNS